MPNSPWAPRGCAAEAGDDLVEDQQRARRCSVRVRRSRRNSTRLEVGAPALHRLDHDRGQLVRALAQDLRATRACRSRAPARSATADGMMPGAAGMLLQLARAADDDLVEDAVVGAGEDRDRAAPGDGARDAHRAHHRLGAGVAERGAVGAGELAEQLGDLARQHVLRADLVAAVDLGVDRLDAGSRAASRTGSCRSPTARRRTRCRRGPTSGCRASVRSRSGRSAPWSAGGSR